MIGAMHAFQSRSLRLNFLRNVQCTESDKAGKKVMRIIEGSKIGVAGTGSNRTPITNVASYELHYLMSTALAGIFLTDDHPPQDIRDRHLELYE